MPQNDVLGHPQTRAFLSQCGANSLYEVHKHESSLDLRCSMSLSLRLLCPVIAAAYGMPMVYPWPSTETNQHCSRGRFVPQHPCTGPAAFRSCLACRRRSIACQFWRCRGPCA